mmetsp:Transcript_43878/g.112966  ORF Transcript_43878/g.112966 Transcript_43878/m.112966 type:complete len:228 (-) Transcript_43878:556-1239(-)
MQLCSRNSAQALNVTNEMRPLRSHRLLRRLPVFSASGPAPTCCRAKTARPGVPGRRRFPSSMSANSRPWLCRTTPLLRSTELMSTHQSSERRQGIPKASALVPRRAPGMVMLPWQRPWRVERNPQMMPVMKPPRPNSTMQLRGHPHKLQLPFPGTRGPLPLTSRGTGAPLAATRAPVALGEPPAGPRTPTRWRFAPRRTTGPEVARVGTSEAARPAHPAKAPDPLRG